MTIFMATVKKESEGWSKWVPVLWHFGGESSASVVMEADSADFC